MARVLQKLGRNREANDQMAKVREIHDAARLQDLQKLGQVQP
jgi:hypothetical protein